MNKIQTLIVSILLILAAIVIHFLLDEAVTNLDKELIGFFTGFCLAGGIVLFLTTLFKKKI